MNETTGRWALVAIGLQAGAGVTLGADIKRTAEYSKHHSYHFG